MDSFHTPVAELDAPPIVAPRDLAIPDEVRPYLKPAAEWASRSPVPGTASPAKPTPQESSRLFRVVWRWHFYAGVFVTPFLMTLAITGALYIFQSEVVNLARSSWVYVTPGSGTVTYQAQLDAALKAHPGARPISAAIRPEPDRSTLITLSSPAPEGTAAPQGRGRGRNSISVYVNPYTGAVLGSLKPGEDRLGPFFNTVLSIHRNLFIGMTGRVITEVVTGWTIVLLVTGIYLWWPRVRTKVAGVWLMRLKGKKYTVLRDLHSVSGAYLMPVALIIAVTGLFYTQVQGKIIHDAAHAIMEDPETPAAGGGERRGSAGGRPGGRPPAEPELPPGISLDEVVAIARREYPGRLVFANLGGRFAGDRNTIRVSAGNDFANSYGPYVSTNLTLGRKDGAVQKREHLSEGGHFWHGWTYPLHVGSFYGPTTKVIWFIACLILAALPVTGLWMWWQRRPTGQSGLPRRRAVRLSRGLIAAVVVLCLFMPMLAASVVLLLLGEWLVRLVRRRRTIAAA